MECPQNRAARCGGGRTWPNKSMLFKQGRAIAARQTASVRNLQFCFARFDLQPGRRERNLKFPCAGALCVCQNHLTVAAAMSTDFERRQIAREAKAIVALAFR